jgi:hypothetical protein
MEDRKENKILFQLKKTKTKNCFGPMTFKLLTKNKNINLVKFFQEKNSKIKSNNTSRNKGNYNIGEIKNIKYLLLHNTKNKKKKNSHSSNNSKLKGERNLKKELILSYQTFNKTSMNQWKTKYNSKNISSKIQYTNPDIPKNMSIPSPHIRQYSKEYNIINSRQKSTITNDKTNKKKINLLSNLQIYMNKREKNNHNKNKEEKIISNKDENIYLKLENIKFRCHRLLKNLSDHTNYLKDEIDKYKNKNYNISLKYNKLYSTNNSEV